MDHNSDQNKMNKKEIVGVLIILFSFYRTYILFELVNEVAPGQQFIRVRQILSDAYDQEDDI